MKTILPIIAIICMGIANFAGSAIPADLRIILMFSGSILMAIAAVLVILEQRRKATKKDDIKL